MEESWAGLDCARVGGSTRQGPGCVDPGLELSEEGEVERVWMSFGGNSHLVQGEGTAEREPELGPPHRGPRRGVQGSDDSCRLVTGQGRPQAGQLRGCRCASRDIQTPRGCGTRCRNRMAGRVEDYLGRKQTGGLPGRCCGLVPVMRAGSTGQLKRPLCAHPGPPLSRGGPSGKSRVLLTACTSLRKCD